MVYSKENIDGIKKLWKTQKKKWEDWRITIQEIIDSLEKIEAKGWLSLSNILRDSYYKKIEDKHIPFWEAFLFLFKESLIAPFKTYEQLKCPDLFKWKKEDIFKYCDCVREMYSVIAKFYPSRSEWETLEERVLLSKEEMNSRFYTQIGGIYFDSIIVNYYNQFRNHLTKKPYKTEKVNVKFGNADLLKGWTLQDKGLVYWWNILKKNGKYYLWILVKQSKFFNDISYTWGEYYDFMKYYSCDYAKVIKLQYTNTYGKKLSEMDFEKMSSKELKEISIQIIKIISDYAYQRFPWIRHIVDNKERYNSPIQIEEDFKKSLTYKVEFSPVEKEKIDSLIAGWSLLLFEISSKDFSTYKHENSTKDLNTMYFEELFSERNLKILSKGDMAPSIFELEGNAQVFFRDKSISEQGKQIKGWKNKHEWLKIIKNKRFTQEKLLFHLPLMINYGLTYNWYGDFNKEMNKKLLLNKDIKFVWIDRWEKYLWYAVVIDGNWKIVDRIPLNGPISEEYPEGLYKTKLVEKERELMNSRKNWEIIGTIKELKEWYVSRAVKEIVDLAIKHHAIIILENLRWEFKESRKKIDRQVYNKLETWLLKKLNYVCHKEKGVDKGLQLTPYFYDQYLTAEKMDNSSQLGILFYVDPRFTSQVCPNCWFIRSGLGFDPNVWKDKMINQLNKKIVSVQYKWEERWFAVTYVWDEEIILYSNVPRLVKDRKNDEKKRTTKRYDITEKFKNIFNNISLDNENLLIPFLKEADSKAISELLKTLNILIQVRNSNTEKESLETHEELDFIACPQCGYITNNHRTISEDGKSRNIQELDNADANGAYHIARKWAMMFRKMQKWADNNYINLEEFREGIKT